MIKFTFGMYVRLHFYIIVRYEQILLHIYAILSIVDRVVIIPLFRAENPILFVVSFTLAQNILKTNGKPRS